MHGRKTTSSLCDGDHERVFENIFFQQFVEWRALHDRGLINMGIV